jgi:hypothetical protein
VTGIVEEAVLRRKIDGSDGLRRRLMHIFPFLLHQFPGLIPVLSGCFRSCRELVVVVVVVAVVVLSKGTR